MDQERESQDKDHAKCVKTTELHQCLNKLHVSSQIVVISNLLQRMGYANHAKKESLFQLIEDHVLISLPLHLHHNQDLNLDLNHQRVIASQLKVWLVVNVFAHMDLLWLPLALVVN